MIVLPCFKPLPEDTSQEVCRASFCGADCETSKKPRGPSSAGSVGRDQIKGVNGGSKLPGIKILETILFDEGLTQGKKCVGEGKS